MISIFHYFNGIKNMNAYRYFSLLILLILCSNVSVKAASWQEIIEKVEHRAEEYHQKATALGWDAAGTLYNEVDKSDHTCAILGKLLGKSDLVKHLEKDYPTVSETGHEFRIAAQSLDNWVGVAKEMLATDKARRIKIWNLDCRGMLGIPASAYVSEEGVPTLYISEEGVLTFYDVDKNDSTDGAVLRILGNVEPGFSKKLLEAIKSNHNIKYVSLGSGGGSVNEALEAGRIIRRFSLGTTLWNECESACALVFLGGVERTIWSPYPNLGFHQVHSNGIAAPINSVVYERIAEYAKEMGVNQRVVINAMLSAPPNGPMKYLEPEEMCEAAIATWIQRWCSHDIVVPKSE